MKRKGLLIAVLAVVLLAIGVYANQKKKPKDEVTGSGRPVVKFGRCDDHLGSSGHGGLSWQLGTQRSGCARGIGFRCGFGFYTICNDGTIVTWRFDAPAPGSYHNNMNASIDFLSIDRLKLSFETPIPADEPRDLPFEVEDDTSEPLPEEFEFNGNHYSQLIVRGGSYKIDYSDGPYGSVVFKVLLVP